MKKMLIAFWLVLATHFSAGAAVVLTSTPFKVELDFTTFAFDPPYVTASFAFELTGAGLADVFLYPELDGSGGDLFAGGGVGITAGFYSAGPFTDADLLDGKWSVWFTGDGNISLSSFFAEMTDSDDETFRITANVSSVPEPSALALFGLALAGLGYSRHRSNKR